MDPLEVPFCILDMPFSFIVDTLCLPYDVVKAGKARHFDPHSHSTKANGP
jgi:Protein of unknown function (DUF1375)